MYRHSIDGDSVIRVADNVTIPKDAGNSDYREVLAWIALGNTVLPAETVAPTVPAECSPRQFRMALTRIGLRATVEAFVASADQDTKDWYNSSNVFQRNNPMLIAAAAALGKTPTEIDAMFMLAVTL